MGFAKKASPSRLYLLVYALQRASSAEPLQPMAGATWKSQNREVSRRSSRRRFVSCRGVRAKPRSRGKDSKMSVRFLILKDQGGVRAVRGKP